MTKHLMNCKMYPTVSVRVPLQWMTGTRMTILVTRQHVSSHLHEPLQVSAVLGKDVRPRHNHRVPVSP